MSKNIILFVQSVPSDFHAILAKSSSQNKEVFRVAVIKDSNQVSNKKSKRTVDFEIVCDLKKHEEILKALAPIKDEILAITCRGEEHIDKFAKVIPNVPYLRTPTSESILWSCNKIQMRKRFKAFNKNITPKFVVVEDNSKESIQKIKEKVGFPLIIKPHSLSASMLVSICYHEQELEDVLTRTFKKIEKIYKDKSKKFVPQILVEQFMEGEMYSVDAYVNSKGKIYFCPFVHIKTGRSIGFDDFFGYLQITPTLLKKTSILAAEEVATQSVHALGLRSSTAHIELMRTEDGWKVIELGPRVGGFRHDLYKNSFGINHSMNDVLIRIPAKPIIPKKVKGYSAAMKFFPKTEGVLTKLTGILKIQELKSFKKISVKAKIGDKCLYAKNGGSSICNIILFNESRAELLADVRRIEKTLIIKTEKAKTS